MSYPELFAIVPYSGKAPDEATGNLWADFRTTQLLSAN